MRGQWALIFGILAALIIAVFAVINVDPVRVNYLFGTNEWPLILVILGSVLMGGVIVGAVGIVKVFQLQQEVKRLNKLVPKEKKADSKEEIQKPSDRAVVREKPADKNEKVQKEDPSSME